MEAGDADPGARAVRSASPNSSDTHALDGALVRLTTNELCVNPVRLANKSHQLLCIHLFGKSLNFLLLCYNISIYARNRKRGDLTK